MDFVHVEGTQTEKPLEFDATTSKTVVYIRKNIERVTKSQDGTSYEVWSYDEAQLPMSEFSAVASEIICGLIPYKQTKTAYIGDTECIFTDTPSGNLTVYAPMDYTIDREGDRVTIYFDPLEEVTEITISII